MTTRDNADGIVVDPPRIQDSHKEILFRDWVKKIKQGEAIIVSARDVTNNLTEIIHENLFNANLIHECPINTLSDVKTLTKHWQDWSKTKANNIKKLSKLTFEHYWQHLVKLHCQWLMLQCLTNITAHMLPTLFNAVYARQMRLNPAHLPELKPMIDIYELRQQTRG